MAKDRKAAAKEKTAKEKTAKEKTAAAAPKTKADESKSVAIQYSFFKAQAEAASRELGDLNMAITDLATAKVILEDIKKCKPGQDVLLPIGGNTFLSLGVSDVKKVLTGTGADVVMQKPIEEVIKSLDESLEKLGGREKTVLNQLEMSNDELEKMAPKIAALREEMTKHGAAKTQ